MPGPHNGIMISFLQIDVKMIWELKVTKGEFDYL